MDKKNQLTYTLIETAVDKGLRDIKENSGRGTRNLVDLGIHFATGRFQKDFFLIARQILSNEESPYYELVNYMVKHVEPRLLKRFGINLGYNCWCYGAEKIRKCEKRHGYYVPWTLIFDFPEKSNYVLSKEDISKTLHTGETLGIYCGMFFLDVDVTYLKMLLELLADNKESCYFILLQPKLITDEVAELTARAGNIVVVLALNSPGDYMACNTAAQLLTIRKCLYGAYCTYKDENMEYIISPEYLKQIEDLHCSFAFLVRQALDDLQNKIRFSQFMETAKKTGRYNFFLVDFYEDLAYVDRNISKEDCLMIINGDGTLVVLKGNIPVEELNIRTDSLQTIFKEVMSKSKYV